MQHPDPTRHPATAAGPVVEYAPPAPRRARRLVVLVPAIHASMPRWDPLRQRLQMEPGFGPADATWLTFDHRTHIWSRGSAEKLSIRLANEINQACVAEPYDEVILVGHSLGGLLVRRAYLHGIGAVDPARRLPWAQRVTRIVLFAALNRGVDTNRRWFTRLWSRLMRAIPHPHLTVEDLYCGGVFLTNLRIDWIRHFGGAARRIAAGEPGPDGGPIRVPDVYQVIGDDDGVVAPDDSRDLLAFGNAREIAIPGADHLSVYRVDEAANPEGRYALIRSAFITPPALPGDDEPRTTAERLAASPVGRASTPIRLLSHGKAAAMEAPLVGSDHRRHCDVEQIDHIIFLLHGIRSGNVDAWLAELGRRIEARGIPGLTYAKPTYGYFSAFRFILPSVRRRNARRFRDWYAELLAAHPLAEFSIIAHSNGTYMLGHTLSKIHGMRFRHVVLAGSVLPVTFDWDAIVRRGQVESVLNERANGDVPVAILCSALRGVWQRDIGPAGFAGFQGNGEAVHEVAYHPGGHCSALRPDNLDRLVSFAIDGECVQPASLLHEPGLYRQLSNAGPYLGFALVAFVALATAYWVATGAGWEASGAPVRALIAAGGAFLAYLALEAA